MSNRTARLLVSGASAATLLVAAEASANTRWHDGYSPTNGGWNVHNHVRATGDVDGDGKADLVGFADAGVLVSRSTGSGFGRMEVWLEDMTPLQGGWLVADHPRVLADVNGDGRDDIVGFSHWGTLVALSTGTSFAPAQYWLDEFGYASGMRTDRHVRRVADVDGDGLADVVVFGEDAVRVAFSTGSGFKPSVVVSGEFVIGYGGWNPELHPRFIADVDGDGDGDIVGFSEWGTLVSLWTGSGYAPLTAWAHDFSRAQGWSSQSEFPRELVDVDGDGRADIVGHGYMGTAVARSTGAGFATGVLAATDMNWQSGWRADEPRAAADVDGDGHPDLVGWATDGVRVMLGDGQSFHDRFGGFGGADYVSRLVSAGSGLCLFATGDGYVRQVDCADRPVSWVLDAQGDDGSFLMRLGDRCIRAENTGAVVEGVSASAAACGQEGNRWRLERTAEGRVRVRNQDNDMCLGVGAPEPVSGHTVIAQPCVGSAYQLWSLDSLRPQQMTAKLRAHHSGRCLWAPAHEARTLQWDCQDAPEQDLLLTDLGDGSYTIQSGGDHQCLGIDGASGAGGAEIRQQACSGGRHQRWAVRPLADGGNALVSLHTGQCFDIAGADAHNGGRLIQWGCHGGANQRFDLIDLASTAPMTTSLQNVGGPEGTALVIANGSGGYITHDPRAILRALELSGQIVTDELIARVLSPIQRQELLDLGGEWDGGSADFDAEFRMFTLRTDAELSQSGVTVGGNMTFVPAVGISGQVRFDARYFAGSVDFSFTKYGLSVGGAGFDTPIASGGFSVDFTQLPTDFDFDLFDGDRIGLAVQLGGFNLNFALDIGACEEVASYVDMGAGIVASSAEEAFNSVSSWADGALDAVEDALGAVGGFFEDVGGEVCDWTGWC